MPDNKDYIEKIAKEALMEHYKTGKSLTECAVNATTYHSLSENNMNESMLYQGV